MKCLCTVLLVGLSIHAGIASGADCGQKGTRQERISDCHHSESLPASDGTEVEWVLVQSEGRSSVWLDTRSGVAWSPTVESFTSQSGGILACRKLKSEGFAGATDSMIPSLDQWQIALSHGFSIRLAFSDDDHTRAYVTSDECAVGPMPGEVLIQPKFGSGSPYCYPKGNLSYQARCILSFEEVANP